MKRAALALATVALAVLAIAADGLELLRPSVPPTPPGASAAAGYLAIVNAGTEDERLLGASAPFADGVELHRTTVEDDVARMRRLDDGLSIPAGAIVRLEPGGTHLMFIGLAEPLRDGERRPVTLLFERAGEVEIDFAIGRPESGGEPADPTDRHGEMDHGSMGHDDTMSDDATDRGED